jgi:hypothetical protein
VPSRHAPAVTLLSSPLEVSRRHAIVFPAVTLAVLRATLLRRRDEGAVDDAVLVRLARDGDLTALAKLLSRHRPRLLAIGRGILGDREAAAEVAQETALVAVTELDRLRNPECAGAWLAGIARNLCRRRLRPRSYEEWTRSTAGACHAT